MIAEVPRLGRRSVVVAAGAVALAGCSGGGDGAGDGAGRRAAVPGAAERAQAAQDSTALLVRYDAAAAAHPVLAPRLAPLRAEVARHVTAFGGKAPAPGRPAAGRPATTPAAALAALAHAERALADRRAIALLQVPGELARLMASAAAAGAGHAALLTARTTSAAGAAHQGTEAGR